MNNIFKTSISKHKQSKYFTIMLVPSSSVKTRVIKIPHWAIHIAVASTLLLIVSVLISSVATTHFRSVAETMNMDLEQIKEQNTELKQKSDTLYSTLQQQKEIAADMIDKESQTYEQKIKFYEEKSTELNTQLQELQKVKEEIFNKISSKDYLPDNALENVLNEDKEHQNIGMGGPMLPATHEKKLNELDNVYASLETEIVYQLNAYQQLLFEIEKFMPYFENYPTTWPTAVRKTTSDFGNRTNPFGGKTGEFHSGIDFGVPTGTEVRTTGGGVVTFAGVKSGYGNLVIINHGFGIETYYAHNSKLLVKVNEKVERGHVIAKSGNTGRSTGPHVHYEVRVNGEATNPRKYLLEE